MREARQVGAGHLLVVASQFTETSGGVEAHLQALLPLLVARGWLVSIVYLGHGQVRDVDGVHAIPLSRHLDYHNIIAVPSPAQWLRFCRQVRCGQLQGTAVTCVATQTRFFPMSWLGARLARSLRVPLVHTEHGAGFVVTGNPVIQLASEAVDRTLGRGVLRRADRVVAVSQATRSFVQRLAGVDSVVIGNGLDVDWWSSGHRDEDPSAARRLVFVGRIVVEKGWDAFLEVAGRCRERGWSGEIVVVGDGPDEPAMRDWVAEHGLSGVRLLGRQAPEQIRDLLGGAVYLNPSRAAEGFQLTQLEAVVAGASLITHPVGVASALAARADMDVAIVPAGDLDALSQATWEALHRPRPRLLDRAAVIEWDWQSVADDYAMTLAHAAEAQ